MKPKPFNVKRSTSSSFSTNTPSKTDPQSPIKLKKKRKTNFEIIMENNKKWAKECVQKQADYFKKLVSVQAPKFLWIGCSDSRVPASQIMNLQPGQVFVHSNVANLATLSDVNVQAAIQYAVEYLGVEDIIVAGHYGCGGIKAAFQQNDFGPLQSWISHTRELRSRFKCSLVGPQEQRENILVELNVKNQVINVSRTLVVQKAWQKGRKLIIHGVVYNLEDGMLKDLGLTTSKIQDVPEQYRLVESYKSIQKPQNSARYKKY